MKKYFLFFLSIFIIGTSCNKLLPHLVIEPISQDNRPDGFVDEWTQIVTVQPPPAMPFRFQKGHRIDLSWENVANTGRESELEVVFNVSMGRVGNIRFQKGSAAGIMATTERIESALNSWHFTNNGWGEITLNLNFGSKKVGVDFSDFNLRDGIDIHKTTFYSCFESRSGDIDFQL